MANMFKAETIITSEMICDQIVTAFEGGSNYWIGRVRLVSSEHPADQRPWYSSQTLYEGDFVIRISPTAEGGFDPCDLTPAKIHAGLKTLGEKHHDRVAEIVGENGDAETAGVFLQCCLFGEIVFG